MLINLILNTIENIQKRKEVTKLHLLTGHDSTLWSMMHILKLKETETPPTPSSTMILEFYEDTDEKTILVNVILNDQPQNIAGKDIIDLPLKDFLLLVENYRLNKTQHKLMCTNYRPIKDLFWSSKH